ncbi:MAG: chromate transporter [Nitrospirae bacterium]|nr:chromate transporter [Nitrospirota bacterium]
MPESKRHVKYAKLFPMNTPDAGSQPPSVTRIFLVFLKIGTFAFGGVYSMLSFFERELVAKRQWLTHDDYIESIAIGQMTPGAPIVNTGICIGYRLQKMRGALASTAGQIFTGTVVAILLAVFYMKIKEHPLLRPVMKGIGAAVVGLLLSIIFTMSGKTIKDYKTLLIAVAAFFLLALFKLSPIMIILTAGAAGYLIFRNKPA